MGFFVSLRMTIFPGVILRARQRRAGLPAGGGLQPRRIPWLSAIIKFN